MNNASTIAETGQLIYKSPYFGLIADALKAAGHETFEDDYVTRMAMTLEENIGLKSLNELGGAGLKSFTDFVSTRPNAKPEEMANFFKENIPEYEEKVKQWIKEFIADFIKNLGGELPPGFEE